LSGIVQHRFDIGSILKGITFVRPYYGGIIRIREAVEDERLMKSSRLNWKNTSAVLGRHVDVIKRKIRIYKAPNGRDFAAKIVITARISPSKIPIP
jgi:hypothetical protein